MPPEFNPGAFSLSVFQAFPDIALVVVVFAEGFGIDQGDEGLVVAFPHIRGKLARVGADALALEVFADADDVALEDAVGAAVFFRADGLGKVDQNDIAFPVEDVEGGQVAVDAAFARASDRCCASPARTACALRRRAG